MHVEHFSQTLQAASGMGFDRSQWQDAQARTVKPIRDVGEAVEDLVEGAVAPGGDHDLKPLLNGIGGEAAGIPGGHGELEGAI